MNTVKIITTVPELSYKLPASSLYTGKQADVEAKLSLLDEKDSLEVLMAGLADVYTYLIKTPINPTADSYNDFLVRYQKAYGLLISKLTASLDATNVASERLAILTSVRDFLKATPVSYELVAAYNGEVVRMVNSYADVANEALGIEKLAELTVSLPVSDLSDLAALIGEAEAVSGAAMADKFRAVFAYVCANELDVTAADYAALTARYSVLRDAVVDYLLAFIDGESYLPARFENIRTVRAYLVAAPVSEYAVAQYNARYESAIAERNSFIGEIKSLAAIAMPDAVAPTPSATVSALNYMLGDYNAATTLASRMDEMAKLYRYISAATLPTAERGYASFLASYQASCEGLIAELFEKTVDAAADDAAKVEALSAIKAFLDANPLSKAIVDSYNAKVDATVTEGADALKSYTVFHDIDAAFRAYEAAQSVAEKYAAFTVIYGYSLEKLDVTDVDSVVAFKTAYADVCDDVTLVMLASFNVDGTLDKIVAIKAAHAFLARAPFSSGAVEAFENACDGFVDNYGEGAGEILALTSRYYQVGEYIATFNAANQLDEKIAAFTTLYNYVTLENDKFTSLEADAYAKFFAEYTKACADMTALIASLDFSAAPKDYAIFLNKIYNFITDCPYSNAAVEAYNARLEAFKALDFDGIAAALSAACPAMTYESGNALIGMLDELVAVVAEAGQSKEKLAIAYAHLMSVAKPYDIGAEGFIAAIVKFNEAKKSITDEYVLASIRAALAAENATPESIKAAFLLEREFIVNTPTSLAMVQAFNEIRAELLGVFAAEVTPVSNKFNNNIDAVEAHVKSCPIDTSKLSPDAQATYRLIVNNMSALKAAADHVKVEAYGISFDNVSGDKPLITKNVIVDKVNAFMKKSEISETFSYAEITSYLFKAMFNELVSEIDALEGEDRMSAVAELKAFITEHHVPGEMVETFSEKFLQDGEETVTTPKENIAKTEGLFEELCVIINEFYGADTTADAIAKFFAVADYLNAKSISSESLLTSIRENVNRMVRTLEALTQERIAYLDSLVPFEEYSLGYVRQTNAKNGLYSMNYDFTGLGSTEYAHRQISSTNPETLDYIVKDPITGNYYREYYTGSTKNPYIELAMGDNKGSIVFEIDIMSPDVLTFKNLTPQFTDAITGNTGYSDNRTFRFTDNLLYVYPEKKEGATDIAEGDGILVEGVEAIPGEWMHLTVIWDCTNNTKKIYVDYELVSESLIKPLQLNPELEVSLYVNSARWCNNQPGVYTAYDNLRVYNGTHIRIVDKFEKMNDLEKFEYYLEKISDTSETAIGRLRAYNEASTLYGSISNSVPQEQKEEFLGIDYDGIILPSARVEFMQYFHERVDALWDITLNTSTISKARGDLDEFYDYFMQNSRHMDQSNEEFLEIRRELSRFRIAVERVEAVISLVKSLKKLDRATTAASMKRHMQTSMEYYAACAFDEAGNYETAHADATVQNFLKEVNFTGINEYLAYAEARIISQERYESAERIIDCIAFIEKIANVDSTLPFEEYVAALKAEAILNFERTNPYVDVIRELVETEAYDENCEGVDRAIAIFKALDEIFYETYRDGQYAVIEEKLNAYAAASSYIEKYGLWMFVKNYIEENRVDMNSELGRVYSDAIAAYERELEVYRNDYVEVVQANTAAFIATVEKMGSYVTYSELKPLYDEAHDKYYYNMNVDAPETQAAIAKFLEYQKQLEEIELNSRMFIDTVEEFSMSNRTNQIYRVLVTCGKYVDMADEGVEGVSEALAIYNAKLTAYNAKADAVNSDINDATEIACSVRTGSISATVLAILKAIFSK
ncbi:MAG: hypothetical protein J6V09_06060 [Clostridia bacterium]|nr:hypothetical protein [Clostridia bacterium]